MLTFVRTIQLGYRLILSILEMEYSLKIGLWQWTSMDTEIYLELVRVLSEVRDGKS